MNSASEVLRAVVEALDEAAIPYMLVGSFVSTYYSQPRATYDIDVVISPTHDALDLLVELFDQETTYIGPDPHEALERQDQFNLIDSSSGWKVDFMLLKDKAFDRQQFERRRRATIADVSVWVASAEDTVLAKLRWAAIGGSDRQVEDAGKVLAHRGDEIDYEYVERWADALGLRELLGRARADLI